MQKQAQIDTGLYQKGDHEQDRKTDKQQIPPCGGELEKQRKGQQQSKETVWPIHM